MNKDRKAVLRNAAAFGIVIGLWLLFAMMTTDLVTLLEGLTAVVFVTLITLLASDAMEKAFFAPAKLTWQYLILGILILATDGLWLFFASCTTWMQFVLRGLLMAAVGAGTFCWYWFFYKMSVMTESERLIRILSKAYAKAAKAFPALDDEGVRNALKETLFCRLEGDSLEGELLTDQPFVPQCRTYNQLADSSDISAQEKSSAMTNIASYINTLIARRTSKAKKDKTSE